MPNIDRAAINDVAIVLPDMIGTTICARPAVETIREAFPGARLRLYGFRQVAEFLADEVGCEELKLLEKEDFDQRLRDQLAADGSPTIVFDFLSTPRSEAALMAGGIRYRVGWTNEELQGFGHNVHVPAPADKAQQSVQDYLDFPEAVGVTTKLAPPSLTASKKLQEQAKKWLGEQDIGGDDIYVLGVGGGNARKRWPMENYHRVAEHLEGRGGRAVFFMGPNETGMAAALREALPEAIIAESLPLDLVKGIVSLARAAVCNDHSIMHLAAALGVPTIGIFLASNPEEWFPYGEPSSYVVGPPLPCRPCYSEDCEHEWRCNDPDLVGRVFIKLKALGKTA